MADYKYGINMQDPGGINQGMDSLADFLQKKNQFESKQAQEMALQKRKEDQEMAMRKLIGFQGQQEQTRGFTHDLEMVDKHQDADRAALKSEYDLAKQVKAEQGLGGKGQSYKVAAGKFNFEQNERDPAMMIERQDARNDRDLVKLGERIQKSGVPENMSSLANLETGTNSTGKGGILTDPNYQVKSAGPWANAVRNVPIIGQTALNVGERVGLMPRGATQENALIQRLVNVDTHLFNGANVTAHEEGRQKVEKGLAPGGDPNLIRIGIKQMQDAIESNARTIKASTRPSIIDTYKNQGGSLSLEDYIGKPSRISLPGQSPIPEATPAPQSSQSAPTMSFEEYKARKRAGTL